MRRTKEEAEQTRRRIMSAALPVFDERGIAHTTMEHIAEAAGVTRGAIYWHFADKQALLRAIRQDVSLPLVDRADFTLLSDRQSEPLKRIERFLLDIITAVDQDARTRIACSVMSFKCEYVGELEGELDDYVRQIERTRKNLTQVYVEARERKQLRAGLKPEIAALETIAFLTGVIRLVLLDRHGTNVSRKVRALVAAHIDLRRASRA
jgi:TetR/AcrR family transcriptional regulator, acrAB operon repressor